MQRAAHALLLGGCGLERAAAPLRALIDAPVTVGGWTQLDLIDTLRPALVYVDLFGWEVVAPLCVAAITGAEVRPAWEAQAAVVASLKRRAAAGLRVVYRGLRRPSAGAFGLLDRHLALDAALDALSAGIADQKVLDVSGLWARLGLPLDDTRYGMGHGEPLDITAAAAAEAGWLQALWRAATVGPIKCIVLDLDDTLIHGEVADDQLHSRNPAYLPEGEAATAPTIEGWWRLKRGLHEALRLVARRGVVLAMATRNDPAVVARRWRKRPPVPDHNPGMYSALYDPLPPSLRAAAFDAHPSLLDALAIGPDDMVCIEAGFGPKSQMCLRIAHHLGVSPSSLAFLDDSPFERAEVAQNAPDVLVLHDDDISFRDQLLLGAPFTTFDITPEASLRQPSYRSRALASAASDASQTSGPSQTSDADPLLPFLHSLRLHASVRPATPDDLPRLNELLLRSHQLNLTATHGPLSLDDLLCPDTSAYVASCRDRIADHGLIAVGVFRHHRLSHWACSCRVLPHRVAPSLLWAMLCYHPNALVERVPTERNGATTDLIPQSSLGIAPWLCLDRAPHLDHNPSS
jgi:FkbH-like protein